MWNQPTAQGLRAPCRYPLTPPLQSPHPCTLPLGSLAFPLTPWSPLPSLSFSLPPFILGIPPIPYLSFFPNLFPLPLSGHTLGPPTPLPPIPAAPCPTLKLISVFVFIGRTITIMGSLIIAMNIHSAGVALGLGIPMEDGVGKGGRGAADLQRETSQPHQ